MNDNKTITKSIKLSPQLEEMIKASAKEQGMNFSQYMIYCAIHKEDTLSPEILCRIENIINKCTDYISDSNDLKNIRGEVEELWDLLK